MLYDTSQPACFTDANWRVPKSTSSCFTMLANGVVYHNVTLQNVTQLLSTAAELCALSDGCRDLVYICDLCVFIGIAVEKQRPLY